ncbi:MAG TPA: 16S rRNA (adenine(1518)-N(6)/adenine(1519)-N(6))-dimethyltransferase RsmA [Verrucomicrobiae bacterium]|nr:16S rRNA (adenine(1518)-N(6)/adenine(1519)-N(6))-dimethyltransferase RsmA [Verrucomicrobiae bacterium]
MRQILDERGIKLTKSLGQNFLHDTNQLRRIVELAELSKADRVLEIGPGLGPLTELLVERAGEVLAIEKDKRLCEVLRNRFPQLQLLHDDALEYLQRSSTDWEEWKLVANLPYSVASPIIVELCATAPAMMVVTLQLEVVRRLVAKAGSPDYGLLTLLVQLHYQPREHFKISPTCFFPPPDVDSACIKLVRRSSALLSQQAQAMFRKLVKRGFSQRRKMMLKLLKQDWAAEKLHVAFAKTGLPETIRAEQVELLTFVKLAEILHQP